MPGQGSGNPLVLTGETLALPVSCPRPHAMPEFLKHRSGSIPGAS